MPTSHLIVLVAAFAACSPSSAPRSAPNATGEVSEAIPDSLRLQLRAPPEAATGVAVPFTIELTNQSARKVTLYLRGREIAFDIHVIDARGDTVWQRLYDQIVPAIVQVKELEAGESLTLRHSWDQRTNAGTSVPPGELTIVGSILRDEPAPMRTPPVRLRIVPPRGERRN